MAFQVVFYLCLALCAGVLGKDLRIIGGNDGNKIEFPYIASLRIVHQIQHICAGIIVTKKHILSSAHCIYGKQMFYRYIRVYVGIDNLYDFSEMPYRVESVHIHPQYNGERVGINGYHNDIVIYNLEENIVFNEYQNKISLPVKNVGPAMKVVVSGWGITFYPTKRTPEQIQKLSLIAMDPANCYKKFNISIVADEICTFTKGAGVCNGDSGGPVVRHDKLVGIVSHGFPCVMGMPDIHTNVYMHLDFIKSIIDFNTALY